MEHLSLQARQAQGSQIVKEGLILSDLWSDLGLVFPKNEV